MAEALRSKNFSEIEPSDLIVAGEEHVINQWFAIEKGFSAGTLGNWVSCFA